MCDCFNKFTGSSPPSGLDLSLFPPLGTLEPQLHHFLCFQKKKRSQSHFSFWLFLAWSISTQNLYVSSSQVSLPSDYILKSIQYKTCFYTQMFVCVCVCIPSVQGWVCVHVCIVFPFSGATYFVFYKTEFFIGNLSSLLIKLGWLASEPQGSSCLILSNTEIVTVDYPYLVFYMGAVVFLFV